MTLVEWTIKSLDIYEGYDSRKEKRKDKLYKRKNVDVFVWNIWI